MKITSKKATPPKDVQPLNHNEDDAAHSDMKDADYQYPDYDEFLNPNPYSGHDDTLKVLQSTDYMDRLHGRK